MSPRRGPELPYSVVAGVVPTRGRWLVASAKVQGSTFAPEPPRVYDTIVEALDERPSFATIVIAAPVGYRDTPDKGPRICDLEARRLLGARGKVLHNAPLRTTILQGIPAPDDEVDAITATLLPSYQEVAKEMSSYRQRTVFEGNAELSFYFMNGNVPLQMSKKILGGRDERRVILDKRVPGVDKILDIPLEGDLAGIRIEKFYDASALLATARRVFTKSAKRIPTDGEWDSDGLRMEIVY
jgi:predicted RNase H-like nuclease